MKRALVVTVLGALAALVPAGSASAAKCVWSDNGIHIYAPTGDYLTTVPLFQADPHCLDHLLP